MMKKKYIAWILIVSILFLGRGADAMAKTSLSKPLGVLANGVDGQVVLSWESVQRMVMKCLKKRKKKMFS